MDSFRENLPRCTLGYLMRQRLTQTSAATAMPKMMRKEARCTNPKDKRTYDIHPTEKAVAVYPALQSQIEAGFGRMTARMTKEGRRQFQRLLALAADACLEPED